MRDRESPTQKLLVVGFCAVEQFTTVQSVTSGSSDKACSVPTPVIGYVVTMFPELSRRSAQEVVGSAVALWRVQMLAVSSPGSGSPGPGSLSKSNSTVPLATTRNPPLGQATLA